MNVVLLRVGIDSGRGGMQGPLFRDGSFDYVPVPDLEGCGPHTYGNTLSMRGRVLIDYFKGPIRESMINTPLHYDPEFVSFTYGDPHRPKKSLSKLQMGDLLVFYCGLEGWDFESEPALYLLGYFEVHKAGLRRDFTEGELQADFPQNYHIQYRHVENPKELVLVKGGPGSRMLKRAVKISSYGEDKNGVRLKVLSSEMQKVFGNFTDTNSIQRSLPRWVPSAFVSTAAGFVRSLE